MTVMQEGMQAAQLSQEQLDRLISAEKEINNQGKNQEVYLLAVTRP